MQRLPLLAVSLLAATLGQAAGAQGLDLTVNHVGLAIGDVPKVTGIRLNFRDRDLQWVHGINATVWNPYQPATGDVTGIALGVPVTGARTIRGLGVGVFGLGADRDFEGVGVAPIGLGAGGKLSGIMLGGIGVGSGGGLSGLAVGGVGVGSGGDVRGIMIGGIGVGGGGRLDGLAIGGIGVGAGADARGILVGGIGVGGGGNVTGLAVGGIGVGSGGNLTGISIGGLGVGAGGRVKGLAMAVVGVGAPEVDGVVVTAFGAGGERLHGIFVAPGWLQLQENGRFDGGSISVYNQLKGSQHGITIGIVNYARELHGAQIGLINIVDGAKGRRVLPIFNYGR